MATSNRRDVSLGVSVETAGEDELRRLATSTRQLAQEGSDAAPEFQRLANELDRLADQTAALSQFKTAAADLAAFTQAQQRAAAAAQNAQNALAAQAASVERLGIAQKAAASDLAEAEAVQRRAADALKALAQDTDRAGRQTAEYRAQQADLRTSLNFAREAVIAKKTALETANAALSEAVKSERALSTEFTRSERAAATANKALEQRNVAVEQTRGVAASLGVSLDNLSEAEQRLAAAQRAGIAAVEQANAARVAGARAAAQAAQEDAASMAALERAAAQADRELEDLTRSLRSSEQAAREFATAAQSTATSAAEEAAALERLQRAARELINSEAQLTAAQRELAASRDAGRASLIAEAQQVLTAKRAVDEQRESLRQLGQEWRNASNALRDAFGTTGVRSLNAIEVEIRQVENATSLLERRFRAGEISANDLARALSSAQVRLQQLKTEANTIPALPGALEQINSSVLGLVNRFGALSAAIATVGAVVKPVIDATVALDQMRRVLTTVTGSAETAAAQIEFVRNVAQRSGAAFGDVGQSYSKFAASALQTGLSLQTVRQTFESVSLAAGNLGLSSDQTKRALEALGQIASKGVASMEELRQQLGDALPGVLPLLARELGLTTSELNKVVESGQLLAAEAIPAIGRALGALQPQAGVVSGIVAEWNRFKNVVLEAGTAITEGPIGAAAGGVLVALSKTIQNLSFYAVSASEGIALIGKTIGITAGYLIGGAKDWNAYQAALSEAAEAGGERLQGLADRINGVGEAGTQAGNGIRNLGTSFAQLALATEKSIDAADTAAQSAQKLAQAKNTEADAAGRAAKAAGLNNVALDEAARVAAEYADALDLQAAADQRAAAVRQQALKTLQDEGAARGFTTDQIKKAAEELQKEITLKTAEAEKSIAAAAAARAEAAARIVAADAVKQTAGEYDRLRSAANEAAANLERVTIAYRDGKASAQAVEEATIKLQVAKGLLRNSINDLMAVLDQQLKLDKADLEVKAAQIRLDIERLRTQQLEAERLGQISRARELNIRIAELELTALRASSAARADEAEKTLAFVEAQRRQLAIAGLLTPEKQRELDLLARAAEAKRLEALATDEQNKRSEANLEALKNNNVAVYGATEGRKAYTQSIGGSSNALDTDTKAAQSNTAATDNLTASQRRLLEIRQRYADLVRNAGAGNTSTPATNASNPPPTFASDLSGLGARNSGFANAEEAARADRLAGNTGAVDNSYIFALKARLDRGEYFAASERAAIENALRVAKDNAQFSAQGARGIGFASTVPSLADDTSTWVQILTRVLERTGGGVNDPGGPRGIQPRVVNINLGGRTTPVTTASDADADQLVGVLQQLETASQRS
jgi:tape measure domain-containing protein